MLWFCVIFTLASILAVIVSIIATLVCLITKKRVWIKWFIAAIVIFIGSSSILSFIYTKTDSGSNLLLTVGKYQYDNDQLEYAIKSLGFINSNAPQYPEAQSIIRRSKSRLEARYKESCTLIDYREMEKKRDALAGKRVKLRGRILEITEDSNGTFIHLVVTNTRYEYDYENWDDVVAVFLDGRCGALRDDNVTVWGEITSTSDFESMSGRLIVVPSVHGKYMEYPRH